ncbi:MAG: putative Zn-dependent protease [Lentimonas sp.]|jgi:predicted Zn-dependent protease
MSHTSLQDQIDDATLDFTLGESENAIQKLETLVAANPQSFEAWHALTEIHFSEGQLDAALTAAQKALALSPTDIHINTSLSRIWMERGDKTQAEHFGAQARMLGWKDELKSPPEKDAI